MLRNFLIALLSFLLSPLFSQYSIHLSVQGIQDGKCYLFSYYGIHLYPVDSAIFNSHGEALLENPRHALPPGIYLLAVNSSLSFPLPIEGETNIAITMDTSRLFSNLQIKGSKILEEYADYVKIKTGLQYRQLTYERALASCSSDSVAYWQEKINALYPALRQKQDVMKDKFKGSLLEVYMTLSQKPSFQRFTPGDSLPENFTNLYQRYVQHYFDNISFSYEPLVRIPEFEERLAFFFTYVLPQQQDTLIKYMDHMLRLCESSQEVYKFVLRWFFNASYSRHGEKTYEPCFIHLVDHYYLQGKAFWAKEDFLRMLAERVELMRPTLYGKKVPDISLMNPDGKRISLYQIQSPYTILYFYEYDCGICQRETPKLMELYKAYKGKVEVMAVYLYADKSKWIDYITKNKLTWINVHDPEKESNLRKLFFIQQVPDIFLLDREKKVLEKHITAEKLQHLLPSLIK